MKTEQVQVELGHLDKFELMDSEKVQMFIEGEIIRVFDKKSGEGEYGPWSFQTIIIKDVTGEGTVVFKTRTDTLTKEDIGRNVNIASKHSPKGWKGVKVESREFKDKKTGEMKPTIEVIVTPNAIITDGDGATGHSSSDSESLSKGMEKEVEAALKETSIEREERLAKESADKKAAEEFRWSELKLLRKESIQETYNCWIMTVMESKIELTPEVLAAVIRVCGPNADTLLLSKLGKR